MDHQLIFIEGLPRLVLRGFKCSWYLEEAVDHPVTLWVLYVPVSVESFLFAVLHLLGVHGVDLDDVDRFIGHIMDQGFGIGTGRFIPNQYLITPKPDLTGQDHIPKAPNKEDILIPRSLQL
jgi:hypothetical protein